MFSAPPAYRPPQKCNVRHTALTHSHVSSNRQHRTRSSQAPHADRLARTSSATSPGSLPPSSPAHHASARPPPARSVYHQKRAKKRRQTFVTPRHAAARDSLGTHAPAALPHVRHASLSTAQPFLTQQQPLQLTLPRTPPSEPVFIIFSRPALPLCQGPCPLLLRPRPCLHVHVRGRVEASTLHPMTLHDHPRGCVHDTRRSY